MNCPPCFLYHLSMRSTANAGHRLRGFNQRGGGDFKVNILDKIMTNNYNSVMMKDSCLFRSVGISYFGVYWNVQLCRVTQEGRKKKLFKATRDRSKHAAAPCTTVWKVITARKLFTMFFTSIDHVGNLHQGCNCVCYLRALNGKPFFLMQIPVNVFV